MVEDEYAQPIDDGQRPLLATLQSLPPASRRRMIVGNKAWGTRFLYKFRPLSPDDEQSLKHTKQIIVDSKLWLSSPRDFNDPFDLKVYSELAGTPAEKRRRYKDIALKYSKNSNWKKRAAFVERLMARSPVEEQERLRTIVEHNRDKVGVVSFAGDPRSILMWSHYGRFHTGICLQFDVDKDHRVFLGALAVNYTTKYPVFNLINSRSMTESGALLSKFEAWKYEGERRIVIPEAAHKFHRFRPEALVGIILGCRTSSKAVSSLRRMLDERRSRRLPDIRLYQAHQHTREYKLRIHALAEGGDRHV